MRYEVLPKGIFQQTTVIKCFIFRKDQMLLFFQLLIKFCCFSAGVYSFKVSNRNTGTRCKTWSKQTMKNELFQYLYC